MEKHIIEMWACDAHLALVCQIVLSMARKKIATVKIPRNIARAPEEDVPHCEFCGAPARFLIEAEGPPLPVEQRELL